MPETKPPKLEVTGIECGNRGEPLHVDEESGRWFDADGGLLCNTMWQPVHEPVRVAVPVTDRTEDRA